MKFCLANHYHPRSHAHASEEIPLSQPEVRVSFYRSTKMVPQAYWDLAMESGDYFLQKNYLELLEEHPPAGIQFCYWLFYYRQEAVGIAYGQTLQFRADEHLRRPAGKESRIAKLLSGHIRLNTLICGNIFLTGQHAFYFRPAHHSLNGAALREALEQTADQLRQQGERINAILLKDLEATTATDMQDWRNSEFHQLAFQPNMILSLANDWRDMTDYLDSLTSKYRVRYRRARKKLQGVRRRELNADQIRAFEPELYALYRKVAESSDFCVSYLPEDYFSALKMESPEAFRLWAYIREERILGFCTTIRNGHQLEAHFLGLDDQQQEYQLYLNMLYDLIDVAIDMRVEQLIFSRTALEIKSSVGARPQSTSVFLSYHAGSLLNKMLPQLVRWLEPKEELQVRHPFR